MTCCGKAGRSDVSLAYNTSVCWPSVKLLKVVLLVIVVKGALSSLYPIHCSGSFDTTVNSRLFLEYNCGIGDRMPNAGAPGCDRYAVSFMSANVPAWRSSGIDRVPITVEL